MTTLEHAGAHGFAAAIKSFTLSPSRYKRRPWLAVLAVLLTLAVVAGAVAAVRMRPAAGVSYATTPVVKQDLVQSVTATGTVDPRNTIAVGTQESGTISEIDADYNSRVKKGQVLAKLDPATMQASLDQAQAALAQAQAQAQAAQAVASGAQAAIGTAAATERAAQATARAASATAQSGAAGVAAAQSNVTKSQSALALAQVTVSRDESLLGQGYIAASQLDSDRSNLVAAQTALQAAQAALQQARLAAQASAAQAAAGDAQTSAQSYATANAESQAAAGVADAAAAEANVEAARAQVATAESNVQRTVIVSPVDGTVVSRSVSVGQTVAASLETPTLFSIAQDLNKMEVDLAVGEPDIGNVKPGESVDLSVLAYPNRTYAGTVSQVRIDPTTTNNVVTYTTVVLVDNRDGSLLPGMTANAQIRVADAPGALVVPAAALAYHPSAGGAPQGAAAKGASPWGATTGSAAELPAAGAQSQIFVVSGGELQRIPVKIQLVSGAQAAVSPLQGTLTAGEPVVTADSSASGAGGTRAAPAGNPLAGAGGAGGAVRGIR